MPDIPKDLSQLSLAEIAQLAADQRLPPVESWAPTREGHSDMRIARDGTWYHEGGPIRRETMVRLFSTILRKEADGRHVLVTPAEKLDIDVEDTPFLAVEAKSEGYGRERRIAFRLNTGDLIVAGPSHALRIESADSTPRPLLHVRGGMEALIARPAFYALAEWALAEENEPLGLWSDGQFFPLGLA